MPSHELLTIYCAEPVNYRQFIVVEVDNILVVVVLELVRMYILKILAKKVINCGAERKKIYIIAVFFFFVSFSCFPFLLNIGMCI